MATENRGGVLDDYATRYEELLLTNRKLLRSQQPNISSNNNPNQRSALLASVTTKTTSLISNHAAMSGMLQCAIRAAKQSPEVSGDTVESIQYLMEESMHCTDYGLNDAGGQIPQMNGKHRNADASSFSCSGLGGCLTTLALEHSRQFESKMQSAGHRFEESHDVDIDSDAEVDAFFHDCPEYNHESFGFFEAPDEHDDAQETLKTVAPSASISMPMSSTIHPKHHQTQTMPIHQQHEQQSSHNNNKPQFNPYAKQNNVQGHDQTSTNSKSNANMYSNNKSSWDAYNSRNEDQHLVPTQQKDNPFRTAHELRFDSSIQGNSNEYQNDYGQNHVRNVNSDVNGNDNANGTPAAPPSNGMYNPSRPNLSAGLKRKFQLPKSRSNNDHHSNDQGARAGTSTNPNTNGHSNRPSSNHNSHRGNDNAKAPPPAEEEDDLPEELKGLDRELITKIENEIVDNGESITFMDIAGLNDAKQTIMELVCWPMKRPDLFTGLRRGPNGLLLFGPPGTGKTLIGKAIAHESGATFFSISSSSLTSKWIGEGEKLVRTLFAVAAYREPAVVFIDEIDSLLTQRKADENEASRRMKTEFLVQLDGTGTSGQGRVLAIGATNRPHELDDAARRRFVKRLYIPLPESEDREILLRTLLKKNKHSLSDKEIAKLSSDGTNGFSGADLKALCTDASLGPIRQLGIKALEIDASDVPAISYKHFRHALKGMNPSVAQADLDAYIQFNETYGSKNVTAENYDELSDEDDSDKSETQ